MAFGLHSWTVSLGTTVIAAFVVSYVPVLADHLSSLSVSINLVYAVRSQKLSPERSLEGYLISFSFSSKNDGFKWKDDNKVKFIYVSWASVNGLCCCWLERKVVKL